MEILLVAGGAAFIIFIGLAVMVARFYRQIEQGKALIINKSGAEPVVTFTGGVVLPVIHRAEMMDISVKKIDVDRRGREGLICKDNIRADIKVTFFVRVNKTADDVLKVAQSLGCVRASDQATLDELFSAKFSEALKSVGKALDFEGLYTERESFRDQIIAMIGKDLNGYVLEDAAIDYLEQTPLELLDPQNILDSDGIRKITDLTTKRNVATNELKQAESMAIGKQNLDSQEALFRYEQQLAEADAKKNEEVANSRSRAEERSKRVAIDEQLETKKKSEKAKEESLVAEQNAMRGAMQAEQARLRDLGIEQVRVQKARDVEEIERKKETQVRDIQREEELEMKKRKIADVIRERIAVDKTVATEEESIKDLRAQAGANRDKEVLIIAAEAQAQQGLVKDIKKAQADEEVAKFRARQRLTLADAELEAADRDARAKIRLAEGAQSEQATEGLAQMRVKEADAQATEKQGLAKVRIRDAEVTVKEREGKVDAEVIRARENANADAIRQKGLAAAQVREAEAQAIEKLGLAEAASLRERLLAEATGKTADAQAIEKVGLAEAASLREKLLAEAAGKTADADAIQKRMSAEADGLRQKGEAMRALDGVGREHEEFRLELDAKRNIALEQVRARIEMAARQAEILGKAFDQAKIQIVGGDGAFFDRFGKSVSLGESIDATVDHSTTLKAVLKEHLSGERNLMEDLKDIAGSVSTSNVRDLTLSAVLGRLAKSTDDKDAKAKLGTLLAQAKELGVDKLTP